MRTVPIRQIVGRTVGVIDEAAFFGDEPVGVCAAAAEIPAERALASGVGMGTTAENRGFST
jgi:hypothetical protein